MQGHCALLCKIVLEYFYDWLANNLKEKRFVSLDLIYLELEKGTFFPFTHWTTIYWQEKHLPHTAAARGQDGASAAGPNLPRQHSRTIPAPPCCRLDASCCRAAACYGKTNQSSPAVVVFPLLHALFLLSEFHSGHVKHHLRSVSEPGCTCQAPTMPALLLL